MKSSPLSITEGPIWKALLVFFFPILFGTFFQQLYNTVDAVIVGRFVGKAALAAVGGGSAVFVNLIVGFFVGLTSGGGVLISQFYGARNGDEISRSVHTALSLSLVCGLVMSVLGITLAPAMLTLIKTPAETYDLSCLYLRIFFMGMIPMSVYNMGSGILRAVGDSRTPLVILIVGCGVNIVLDLVFVVFFRLGISGVAIATVICQIVTSVISVAVLAGTSDSYRFSARKLGFTPRILRRIIRLGIPAGVQSSLYTISNLIIQTFINSFGTDCAAAWAAYGKLDSIFWMIINALGLAITTFSGQNYGAGKHDRIRRGMRQSLALAFVFTIAISVPFYTFGNRLLLLFTDDPGVIRQGTQMLRFLTPFWVTYISIEILSGTVRGAGRSLVPMLITVFGVCLLRIVWLFTAVPRDTTLNMVMASYPITWILTSSLFWGYYLSGKWLKQVA
ncbi:MAG: MATE family efflux transporter [Treponema sp.]|nr:MATE family efflux transporter [Treponema sp.]